jgi:hypothetical protein
MSSCLSEKQLQRSVRLRMLPKYAVHAPVQILQTDYMIGPQIRTDPFHVPVVRTTLTRNLASCFEGLTDELSTAFAELIPAGSDAKGEERLLNYSYDKW